MVNDRAIQYAYAWTFCFAVFSLCLLGSYVNFATAALLAERVLSRSGDSLFGIGKIHSSG
jgi:hypothetical protein